MRSCRPPARGSLGFRCGASAARGERRGAMEGGERLFQGSRRASFGGVEWQVVALKMGRRQGGVSEASRFGPC